MSQLTYFEETEILGQGYQEEEQIEEELELVIEHERHEGEQVVLLVVHLV